MRRTALTAWRRALPGSPAPVQGAGPDHATAADRAMQDHIQGGLSRTQRAARGGTAPARPQVNLLVHHREGNAWFIHSCGASAPAHPPIGRPDSISMASRVLLSS
ncbi:hypothetical protein EF910_00375 [Streptomyces sp. WAC07149]|uniref:hypothetical protein n=1 Tax=Streptomyces sp. WAC07149 TaxID=2487425 RepID=UPI000F7A2571|nr:hypothetical protein [Streptomyces sp. WAC07149]RST08741.1 hypothetical protein EF910_00375 [Streptomyces sp. WAC07149]